MNLQSALEQVLTPYMSRVKVRPGNGLSRHMNGTLRSYSDIPLMIRRSVQCLATLETLFGFTGSSRIHYSAMYQLLIHTNEDWYLEIPVMASRPDTAAPVLFVRKPRVPLHQFSAAWTIARRINLLAGRGTIQLHEDVLAHLRRLLSPTERR